MRRLIQSTILVSLAGATFLNAGCFWKRGKAAEPAAATVTPVRAKITPALSEEEYQKIRPNELGYIPVIMYHEIGGKPIKSDPSLSRSVEAFKKDLELMHAAGFYPVNLGDVVNNTMDVPKGKSPIVLTFDDARESQFRLIETDSARKVDPNCGVGVMAAMHKKHGDEWPMRATFFVMPKSRVTMDSFGQVGMGNDKMAYLVEQGMEIGNHSTFHKNMAWMTPAQIQEELGYAHNTITGAVPGAKIDVVALPMGKVPKDKNLQKYLLKGTYQGKTYEYTAAMAAAYRAMPSPVSKKYDPIGLERIAPIDGRWGVRWWISEMSKGGGMYPRYISDGDMNVVSFPKGEEGLANLARIKSENKAPHAYSPFGGGGGAKPIITEGTTEGETAPPAAAEATAAAKPITTGG